MRVVGEIIDFYNIRKKHNDKESQQIKEYIRPFVTVVDCPKMHKYVSIEDCISCSHFVEYNMCLSGVVCRYR